MTECNQILQRKEYSPESPDEIVVNLASILEEEQKELSILDAELEGTLFTWQSEGSNLTDLTFRKQA